MPFAEVYQRFVTMVNEFQMVARKPRISNLSCRFNPFEFICDLVEIFQNVSIQQP